MLGPHQQQIIEILSHGNCSPASLERQANVSRDHLRDSRKRLAGQGLIGMVGKRGKHGPDGTMVELMREPLARFMWPRLSAVLRPEGTR
jgi:hypothetical protein